MLSTTLRWQLWVGLGIMTCLLAWGCECTPRGDCTRQSDCPQNQMCVANICVPVQAKEPSPEPTTETTKPEEIAKAESLGEALVDTAKAEAQPEPGPEPTREATPEIVLEALGESPQETSDAGDSQDAGPPEQLPEGIGAVCIRPQDCPATAYCVLGHCRLKPECTADSECIIAPYDVCMHGVCTVKQPACRANGECLIGTVCYNGACLPGLMPANCKGNYECPANFYCEQAVCVRQELTPPVQCAQDSECKSWEACFLTRCMRKCTDAKQCPSVSVPQCNAGICVNPNLPPGVCNSDSDCLPRQYCSTGRCITCAAPPDCTQDSDCKSGETCLNGQCGVQCNRDTDCNRGFTICSQGMCRGEGYNPVGCPENREICDLVISNVQCIGNGQATVTVQNVGLGPAVGRFYLCHEQPPGSKPGCQGAVIMNYGGTGSILPPQATTSVTVSWNFKINDIIAVDRPNLILEYSEINNLHQVTQTCP